MLKTKAFAPHHVQHVHSLLPDYLGFSSDLRTVILFFFLDVYIFTQLYAKNVSIMKNTVFRIVSYLATLYLS